MPKVSIIVPVYGVEKYIERCARSLFEQTLDDIEYLFIDDCTPDKSIEILKRVLEDYPHRKSQVIIHRMEHNSGQAAVRKWGMQNATGDYVIHCDSDDWVDIHMYEDMYNKAIEDKADVVVCDYALHDGKDVIKKVRGCMGNCYKKFLTEILFQRAPWSLCNKLFSRKTCYRGDLIYPDGNMGEDMSLCIQLILHCKYVSYVQNAYYYYFCNQTSITNKSSISCNLRNFEHLKSNTDSLISILQKKNIPQKKWIINGLQYNVTIPLLKIMHNNKEYRHLWLNTYHRMILRFLFNPYIDVRRRLKCMLALLWLYPLKKDRVNM